LPLEIYFFRVKAKVIRLAQLSLLHHPEHGQHQQAFLLLITWWWLVVVAAVQT
jgi:hypothetical protein